MEKQTIRKDFYDNIFRISRKHSGKFSYIVPQINKSKNFARCNFQQIRFSGNGIPYPFIFYPNPIFMRRCFTLLTVLVLCASSGCDDKNKEEVADVIVLSRSSVAFAQKGGTTTVAVATPSDWKVSCPDDWVTLASEEDRKSVV